MCVCIVCVVCVCVCVTRQASGASIIASNLTCEMYSVYLMCVCVCVCRRKQDREEEAARKAKEAEEVRNTTPVCVTGGYYSSPGA